MNCSYVYYISAFITGIVAFNWILKPYGITLNFLENKWIGMIVILTSLILLISNIMFLKNVGITNLPFRDEIQNYIYVQPGKKPMVIGWQNPLAQKII